MKIRSIIAILTISVFISGCYGSIEHFTSVRDKEQKTKINHFFIIPDLEKVYGVEFTNAFKNNFAGLLRKYGCDSKSLTFNLHNDSRTLILNDNQTDSIKINLLKSEISAYSPKYLFYIGIDKSWGYTSGKIAKSTIIITIKSSDSGTEIYKASLDFLSGSDLIKNNEAGGKFAEILFDRLQKDKII